MDKIKIEYSPEKLSGNILLPASKSISNRALIIRALCDSPFYIQHLSGADDTELLHSLFQSTDKELFVKNAGTVARFLLAYYACRNCDMILKGSDRMNERPIGELVSALKELGADIEYLEKENHLPVHIHGKIMEGGEVSIPADISSQFISALLMIGPVLKKGITINLEGEIVSEPYIDLTLQMMSNFGIHYIKKANQITVAPQKYQPKTFLVESDWSSASYFYALAALFPGSELKFDTLWENSWQGDSILKFIMEFFGVESIFEEQHCTIKSSKTKIQHFSYDFINHPDLVPTFVCLCCALEVPFTISGTKTLKYKESNRAEVLKIELSKLGYLIDLEENEMRYNGTRTDFSSGEIILDTHDDHRMAMSFAILATKNKNIIIKNPGCVEKSFPGFWDELKTNFQLLITNY
jgi:3-phosphoshikimate 1-carboxyvinyltransferase